MFANVFVFFISAVAHEYWVSVPLRFISYWAFLAMLMQAPTIFLQNKLGKILRIENSELSNVSFWVFFCIIGQPLVVFIYYAMYIDFTNSTTSTIPIPAYIPLEIPIKIELWYLNSFLKFINKILFTILKSIINEYIILD